MDAEDKSQDTFATILEDEDISILKQEPLFTSSFLENIRTGEFSKIYNSTVQALKERKQAQETEIDYSEADDEKLLEAISGVKIFLEKIFLFFMGFLPGNQMNSY